MVTELSPDEVPDEPPGQEDDFLAAWRDYEATEKHETRTILGVQVLVPTDLPLRFERLAESLGESSKEEDIKALLTVLFGQDPLDAWVEAGLTGKQFQVLLAWGVANGQGKPTTFAEAVKLVREAEKADAEGKAPATNRADRRAKASSGTRGSAAGGRTSSRTSSASTKSTRKKSPR